MKPLALMLAVSALVLIGAAPVVNAADRADSKSTKRDALSVSLSANLAPEPAQVNVRVRIEPDPRSRFLMLEWWSEDGIGGAGPLRSGERRVGEKGRIRGGP